MAILAGWRFCPRCRAELTHVDSRVECSACGFVRYANPLPAVAALVVDDEGRLLLGRRAFEPDAGMWDTIGGFLDEEEDAVDALRREVREETGLELEVLDFLGYWLEPYDGRIVLCFTWTARVRGDGRAADDLVELRWFEPAELPPPAELAFTHYPAVLAAAVGYKHS